MDQDKKNGTGLGVFIVSSQGIPTKFKFRIKGNFSNNKAEYEALTYSLEIFLALGAKGVLGRGDSELVGKKLTKEYKCISENLMKYFIRLSVELARQVS